MNNCHSRPDIHIEIQGINAEAVQLAATIKKNFEELGV